MSKEIIVFGNIEIKKCKFHHRKNLIITYWYLVYPLFLVQYFQNMSGYVRIYDVETKWMSFLLKMIICGKI